MCILKEISFVEVLFTRNTRLRINMALNETIVNDKKPIYMHIFNVCSIFKSC